MKKKFENPELIIIYFEGDLATDDIIETSGPTDGWGNDWDNPDFQLFPNI